MQDDKEARRPPRAAAATVQPCLPERGGGEPGCCCCIPGRVVPSTTGCRAIVDARPSSGYSGHLMSERKANAAGSRVTKSPIEKQMQGYRLTKRDTR
jgi:hypothetical protein